MAGLFDGPRKRVAQKLGLPLDHAHRALATRLMFAWARILQLRAGRDLCCHRCGNPITDEQLGGPKTISLDHVIAYAYSVDAHRLFWDLDNVAFSHRDCNSRARRRGDALSQQNQNWEEQILAASGLKEFRAAQHVLRRRMRFRLGRRVFGTSRCYICDVRLTAKNYQFYHLRPWSSATKRGHADRLFHDPANVRMSCRRCNRAEATLRSGQNSQTGVPYVYRTGSGQYEVKFRGAKGMVLYRRLHSTFAGAVMDATAVAKGLGRKMPSSAELREPNVVPTLPDRRRIRNAIRLRETTRMSVPDIAAECGVSPASVYRWCKVSRVHGRMPLEEHLIVALARTGAPINRIALALEISRDRVRKVFKKRSISGYPRGVRVCTRKSPALPTAAIREAKRLLRARGVSEEMQGFVLRCDKRLQVGSL